MFSPCCSRKTEYLHPRKLWIFLPFGKAISTAFRKWLPKNFEPRYFGMWLPPFPLPPAALLFMNFSHLRNRKSSLFALVCNTLLTLWSFSKFMLTCVCCCLNLSSDVVLVNDKLRKSLSNQWNSSAPFPLLPLLSTTGTETQNALFLPPSPVCLVFISRQSQCNSSLWN